MKKILVLFLYVFSVNLLYASDGATLILANGSKVNVDQAFIDRSKTLTNMKQDLGENDENDQKGTSILFSYATAQVIDIIQNLLGADEDDIRAFFVANDFDFIIPVLATAHFLETDLFTANDALKHEVLSVVFQKIQDIQDIHLSKRVIEFIEDCGLSDLFREFVIREALLSPEGEISAAEVALLKPAFYSQERIEFVDQDGQVVEPREDQSDNEENESDNDDQEQDQQQQQNQQQRILAERVMVDFYQTNVSGDDTGDYLVASLAKNHPDFGRLQIEEVRIVKHNNNYFCIAIYDLMDALTPLKRTIRIIDVNLHQDIHVGRLHLMGKFFTNESHGEMYLQYFSHDKKLVTLNLKLPQQLTIRVEALNGLKEDLYIETIKRIRYANKPAILLVQQPPRTIADGTNKFYTVSLYNFDGLLIYSDRLEPSYLHHTFMGKGRYYVSDDNILYYIRLNKKSWSLARYDLIAHKNLGATNEIVYDRPHYNLHHFCLVLWYDKKNKRFVVNDNDAHKYFVFKDKKSELGGSQLIPLSDLKGTLQAAEDAEEKRLDVQHKEAFLGSMIEEGMRDIKHEKHISDLIQNYYLKKDNIPSFTRYIAPTKKLFYLRFYKELQEIETELSPELYEKLKKEIIAKLHEQGIDEFGKGIDEFGNNRGLLLRLRNKLSNYFS